MPARPVIAIIAQGLEDGGGVPAVAHFLARAILATGRYELRMVSLALSSHDDCSVRFTRPGTWRGNPRTRTGTWRGLPFVHVGASGAELEFCRYQPRPLLTQLLRDCNLIQVVAGGPAVALTTRGCGRPVVLQVATRLAVERARTLQQDRGPKRLWREAMTAVCSRYDDLALRHADAVMVENRWMYDYARAQVDPQRGSVHMAFPGIDTQRLSPASHWAQDAGLLFVGRLFDARKNVELLCAAYAQLCRELEIPPPLTLAGQLPLPAAAQAIIAALPAKARVQVVPRPDDAALLDLYQRALAVVIPSSEEGFGMVAVEAMACGKPVVATRCGGPEEIITEGVDGHLVPLADAPAMAAVLRPLCLEPARAAALGEAARRTALERFSEQAAAKPFLQAYEGLLASTREIAAAGGPGNVPGSARARISSNRAS
jgi:glycosyltransferase involved in cell wall biosynthesis